MFNKSLLPISLKFGILAGILTLAYCFIINQFGLVPLAGKKFPSIIFSIFCMVLAVKQYQKNNVDGVLHFWEGLIVGNLTNLIGACVSALGLYFWFKSDSSMLTTYISDTISSLSLANVKKEFIEDMGKGSYDSLLTQIKAISPKDIAWDEIKGLQGKLIFGLLASIMISLYHRRQYIYVKSKP
jgi:hypothetical protein